MNCLITGGDGFLGKHLVHRLQSMAEMEIRTFGSHDPDERLIQDVAWADIIYHLAGVNRTSDPAQFVEVNVGIAKRIATELRRKSAATRLLFASSIHAAGDSEYGRSKRAAEELLEGQLGGTTHLVSIVRWPHLFGKWARPHYNSVVATFCHQLANQEPLDVRNPDALLELLHVDDAVASMVEWCCRPPSSSGRWPAPAPVEMSVAQLADQLIEFQQLRQQGKVPCLDEKWVRQLYSTHVTYLPDESRMEACVVHQDTRGELFEFLKSAGAGQVFVVRIEAGQCRGNHYHQTRIEKCCVLQGHGLLRLQNIHSGHVQDHPLSPDPPMIYEISPGIAHGFQSADDSPLLLIFWSSEVFDKNRPDTFPFPVLP